VNAGAIPSYGSARKCRRRRDGSLTPSKIDYFEINKLDQARSCRHGPEAGWRATSCGTTTSCVAASRVIQGRIAMTRSEAGCDERGGCDERKEDPKPSAGARRSPRPRRLGRASSAPRYFDAAQADASARAASCRGRQRAVGHARFESSAWRGRGWLDELQQRDDTGTVTEADRRRDPLGAPILRGALPWRQAD